MEVTVIAEIGCNHNGSLAVAKRMVREAANAGATFAKFQYYSTEEIKAYETAHPPSAYTPEMFKWIKRTEFRMLEFQELAETCEAVGIGFLCTPFLDPRRVNDLNPLVTHWKIRERDSQNEEMRNAVLNTSKPVFISCQNMPVDSHLLFHPRISWLYCIPQYPADLKQLNLSSVVNFDGYSNHIPFTAAPLATTIAAYTKLKKKWVLECHVMLEGSKAIDAPVSFTFTQLKRLIKTITEVLQCPVSPYHR